MVMYVHSNMHMYIHEVQMSVHVKDLIKRSSEMKSKINTVHKYGYVIIDMAD